jgi:hypothetical protein
MDDGFGHGADLRRLAQGSSSLILRSNALKRGSERSDLSAGAIVM